jgi:hypothetical protein
MLALIQSPKNAGPWPVVMRGYSAVRAARILPGKDQEPARFDRSGYS